MRGTVYVIVDGQVTTKRFLYIETNDVELWKSAARSQLTAAGFQNAAFEFGPIGVPWGILRHVETAASDPRVRGGGSARSTW